jgi:hypothetical protein
MTYCHSVCSRNSEDPHSAVASCQILHLTPMPSSALSTLSYNPPDRHQVSHPHLTRSYINMPMYCSLYIHLYYISSPGSIVIFAQLHLGVPLCITFSASGMSEDRIPVGARFFAHHQTGPGALLAFRTVRKGCHSRG